MTVIDMPGVARSGQEHIRAIASRLRERKSALSSFSVRMEREFLTVGALLRAATTLVRQLRERSNEAAAAVAARKEDPSILFAFELLAKAESLIAIYRKQNAQVEEIFDNMRSQLRILCCGRESLTITLSPLKMTKVHFKIQAVSFEESTRTQFAALADSISEIIRKVDSAVGKRFDELEKANVLMNDMAARLRDESERRDCETDSILAGIRRRLASLDETLNSSESTSSQLAALSEGIAAGVSRAAMALQCQDMARQKLEHVGKAIDQMTSHAHPPPGRSNGESAGSADTLYFLADASRLQLRQLETVFSLLTKAADDVGTGFAEVREASKKLAVYSVHSDATNARGGLIGSLADNIKALLGLVEVAVDSIRHIYNLVHGLKRTFHDCTSEILDLGTELRVMALNAQIFAARMPSGDALEAVARNTRSVANLAMKELAETSSKVNDLLTAIDHLEKHLSAYGAEASRERAELADEADVAQAKLSSLGFDLQHLTDAIGPIEADLEHVIGKATREIRFAELVAGACLESREPFEELSQLPLPAGGADIQSSANEKLESLKQNYTMAQERVVHDSSEPALATDPESSFETDIELF